MQKRRDVIDLLNEISRRDLVLSKGLRTKRLFVEEKKCNLG